MHEWRALPKVGPENYHVALGLYNMCLMLVTVTTKGPH